MKISLYCTKPKKMEGQGATVMRTAAANILKPGGSATLIGVAALFIESTGDILKCKLGDGTILTAKAGVTNVTFQV